jgi:acetoin utilization protein AcuB
MFYVFDPTGVRSSYAPDTFFDARLRLERQAGRVGRVDSKSTVSQGSSQRAPSEHSKKDIPFPGDAYEETLAERREQVVIVSQIMTTSVYTVTPDDTLLDIWKLFRTKRFRHVPVVHGSRVVGMVSDRDVLPSLTQDEAGKSSPETQVVRTVMSAPVLTVRPDAQIRGAARVMLEAHVGALPVVSAENELVGLVTRTDILRAVVQHVPLELWI